MEDEPFIALDLALAVRNADGAVAGPVGTVKAALALLETRSIAGAILDVNLRDGDISAVAEMLIDAGIPVILQTGVGLPPKLAERFPDLQVKIKPFQTCDLVAELAELIATRHNPMNAG